MGRQYWVASVWAMVASVVSLGEARSAANININCVDSPPRLVYHYPNEDSGPLARGTVFWAVGTPQTQILGAYLDESTWLEPAGPTAPQNWQIVPPADLAPGSHTLEFAFENLQRGQGSGVLIRFELSDAEAMPKDGATALEFSRAQRFPSREAELALDANQRDAVLLEKERLAALAGDCTALVDDQYELCYWQHHAGELNAWGQVGGVDLGPDLWTEFTTSGDALGFAMGDRFFPAGCRGVLWDGDGFGGGVEALPLYATGLGSPIPLDQELITDFEPPPPLPPSWASSGSSACAVASAGSRSEHMTGCALFAAASVLALRLRRRRPAARAEARS